MAISLTQPAGLTPEPPLFRDPRFRRLWSVGLLVSVVRWLEMLAYGVFTYEQTRSAFWVAAMTMLRMLPLSLLGIAFGQLAERISRRNGLIVLQGLMLLMNLTLLAIAALGALQVWHLAVACFLNGCVWAGDNPMRRTLIGEIVGPQRMGQAMGFDSIANNGSRLTGPTIGGLLLATGGMPAVLGASALLYVGVLVALLGIAPDKARAKAAERQARAGGALRHLGDWSLLRESPMLSATLFVTVVFNIFCWPVVSMVPVIGKEQLQLSTEGIGLLASTDGLGSLMGALLLTIFARRLRPEYVYVGGVFLFLFSMPLFALGRSVPLASVALFAVGVGQGAFAMMQSALVYTTSPPHRRLTAMGLLTVCIGVAPLGFVLVGWLAQRLGAPTAAMVCSAGGWLTMALSWPLWRACVQRSRGG